MRDASGMTMLHVGCEENRAENRGPRMWSFGGRPMLRRRGAGVGERRNSVIIGAGDADTDRVAPGSRLSFRSGEPPSLHSPGTRGLRVPDKRRRLLPAEQRSGIQGPHDRTTLMRVSRLG